jgi:hypothetical protein
MSNDDRPLSTLVAQGWEIVSYASEGHAPANGVPLGNVLMRRQKQHKLVSIRSKMIGAGYVVKEYDL